MQDKRIYQLIAKQLVEGLNEEEKQELNDWIAEPGNDSFYQEITEKEYVKLRLEKWSSIDVKKHTTAFEREIGIKPVRRVSEWWQCAAAVVIFCIIGIGFWMAVERAFLYPGRRTFEDEQLRPCFRSPEPHPEGGEIP